MNELIMSVVRFGDFYLIDKLVFDTQTKTVFMNAMFTPFELACRVGTFYLFGTHDTGGEFHFGQCVWVLLRKVF